MKVFVLGAGFTRSFAPGAPLLVDDFGVPTLRTKFAAFTHAAAILDDAIAAREDGRVDIEALLTRVGGMPYDSESAKRELHLLESDLRQALVRRLAAARDSIVHRDTLASFARHILETEASIVTFNYDDILDQALCEVYRPETQGRYPTIPYWHPDSGYGFFCRPSIATVVNSNDFMNDAKSFVLKLHGSINWRSRLGDVGARGPAAILHHEEWYGGTREWLDIARAQVEAQLESDPFIVPPVLVKSELAAHPVLKAIWRQAHEQLRAATEVVFIGYSLPRTDLAARVLFHEALRHNRNARIQVVDIGATLEQRELLLGNYTSVFPWLDGSSFEFADAAAVVQRRFTATDEPSSRQAAV